MEEFFDDQGQSSDTIDFGRYIKAIFKRWWVVGLITCATAMPWILKIKGEAPVYKAETWISFERVAGVPNSLIQSRKLQLTSRTFAEEVTAQLGLTLTLIQEDGWPIISRQDAFVDFSTNHEPVTGSYELRFYPTGFCALYHNSVYIDSLKIDTIIESAMTVNGLTFKLNPDIGVKRAKIRFEIQGFRSAVSNLRSSEKVTFNRDGDVMQIALHGPDPIIAAKTVNMLSEIFIQKSVRMSSDRSKSRLEYLKEQLRVIDTDLSRIDVQLKSFSIDHLMGLDGEKRKAMNQLQAFEADTAMIGMYIRDLRQLLSKFDFDAEEFDTEALGHFIFRQISVLDAFSGDQEMALARRLLDDYDEQSEAMEDIPEKNPDVIELKEKIQQVESQVLDLAHRRISELQIERIKVNGEIQKRLSILKSLPTEYMAQLDLVRKQKVKAEVHSRLLREVQEAQISSDLASENVSVLDKAIPMFRPISGDKKKKAGMGLIAALFLGILTAVLIEVVDKRIKTQEDVKRHLKLSLLGTIPKVKFDDTYDMADSEKAKSISSQIVTHDYSPTPVGEAYRSLRTSLLFNKSIGDLHSLAIGSVMPGEGKSFTAANLAITLAQQKSHTLLVDADLRRGVLHNSFNCPKKPGLTNYLTGVVPLENILNETYVPNLSLITCGSLLPNPSELLGSARMKRFIETLKDQYDFIIFDTPPLMAATDSIILSTLVDGFAMLVRSGMTNRNDVKKKLELFNNLQSNVLGVILNCAGADVAHEGYSYYRY
ncbi:polysaccharide biosynthesis tyrosine autokinase [bacterium]|nr:polysaccharide biosynthesis tyrosine autokinase [bacterium]